MRTEPTLQSASKEPRGDAGSPRIAIASEVSFGDIIVGETEFRDVHVFNQERDLAFLSARIEGARTFQIASKPEHLNPSADGFDAKAAIRVGYSASARSADRAYLAVTLRWRDGTSESVRVALHGSAHASGEITHDEENVQTSSQAQKKREAERSKEAAQAEERRISAQEAKGGSDDRRIGNAAALLGLELRRVGQKQQNGVTEAAELVSTYKRRPPAPPPPDVVAQIAMLALDLASGKVASLVAAGIKAVAPSTGAGWTPGTPGVSGPGWSVPTESGTKQLAHSPLGAIASHVTDILLDKGKEKVTEAITPQRSQAQGQGSNAESVETQVEYFALQRDLVADRLGDSEINAIQIKRSLIDFDNPRDAGRAADALRKAADVVRAHNDTARSAQAYETTKGWIRLVSHSALGTATAENQQGTVKSTTDGSATARIEHARVSKPYDGVLELEFDADANNAAAAIRVASTRLFGVSSASAKKLHLESKPLKSAGLVLRARSTVRSSPVHVSIARDEAGNVRFQDESGAPGMPTPWLSRRGGRPGSATAAEQAAKKLAEDLAAKTLKQLGVTLETDGNDA